MSGNKGIAAVVLNYKTWRDAVNCVSDLKSQDHENKHIVVVDNGSGNDSAEELKKLYAEDPMVTVLVSEKNLGFARGNNIGIRYAHEKLGYDTVFVVNSDVRIENGLFAAAASHPIDGVGAISPTVLLPEGEPQPYSVSCEEIGRHSRRSIRNLIKANIAALPPVIPIYEQRAQKRRRRAGAEESGYTARKWILQGCAYFLTPEFFRHYRGLYPRTFLYWEEIDLLLMLKKAGLGSAVIKTPAVTHYGKGSTKNVSRNVNLFRLRQSNRSMIRSLPLIFGMSEKRAARCVSNSPEFISPIE